MLHMMRTNNNKEEKKSEEQARKAVIKIRTTSVTNKLLVSDRI